MHITRSILLTRLVVVGRENIPAHGPYIVTLNHTSVADTPLLLMGFPLVEWAFFAGEKWRHHPIYGPIMAWLGAIYINRGEVDRQGLRDALAAIERGVVFGLAPEGSRSKTGRMQEAKVGAAYLANRANIPILPVGFENNDQLFANFKQLRSTRSVLRIGEPYLLPEIGRRAKGADLAAFTHLIMVKIAALLPPRYWGIYADSPALQALFVGDDPWPACQTAVQQPPGA
ncbi:MAG: 1-acyl-sn-glycerol-3-phosphate acyltransferase [Anaerolineaceae bacterium]|nr:1-acyl-sn-glycerol-3-phosphate acyltransferase [Anaerolineaceae bacterium]